MGWIWERATRRYRAWVPVGPGLAIGMGAVASCAKANSYIVLEPFSVFFLGGITVSIIAFVFTIKFLCELAARVVSFLQNEDPGRRGDRSIYDYVRGNYLDPRSCKVSWDWKEPQEVGQTMTFRVQVGVFSVMFCLISVRIQFPMFQEYPDIL